MATNVELKVRVPSLDALRACVESLADGPGVGVQQEDTFFRTLRGRLKLRVLAPDRGELIYYERENAAGPKPSHYQISPTADPARLGAVLAAALGVRGVVRKQRTLYRAGQTRIHLDAVEGLGAFVELEVVLDPGQEAEEGEAIACDLMARLGIAPADLVEGAYMDLLERAAATPVRKALAYITHGDRLLVFSHPHHPEAGIQVPAGTLEPGEPPEVGVLREAAEETGLDGLAVAAFLGVQEVAFPGGRLQRRYVFHLTAPDEVPERWRHDEHYPSDGSPGPIEFEFFWVRVPDEVPELAGDQGALLPALEARLRAGDGGAAGG